MNDLIKLIDEISEYGLIGPHVRHILEHYRYIIQLKHPWAFDYESKERDYELESDRGYTKSAILFTQERIAILNRKQGVIVNGNASSIGRELEYAEDHMIHHLAIIRLILRDNNQEYLITDDFGVSPSTLKNRKEQQQTVLN